jgi:1,2-diacylglycerol 3-alpha-glucosyltransferase
MGRISYEKSIDDILYCMTELLKTYPELKLKIIGDGPERGKLEQLAQSLGIQNSVVFTGFLNGQDLVESLATSDIYVTTSKSENMPLAVLQAMATGLPIVALSSLGMTEMIMNEENGFLITQSDKEKTKSTLVAKIELLLTNTALRQRMSEKSRELSAQYSENVITKKLLDIYQEVIKNNEQ